MSLVCIIILSCTKCTTKRVKPCAVLVLCFDGLLDFFSSKPVGKSMHTSCVRIIRVHYFDQRIWSSFIMLQNEQCAEPQKDPLTIPQLMYIVCTTYIIVDRFIPGGTLTPDSEYLEYGPKTFLNYLAEYHCETFIKNWQLV